MLAGDAYGEEVRADNSRANELGITGVPFFVVDGRVSLAGAQNAEAIELVVERAWERRTAVAMTGETGHHRLRGLEQPGSYDRCNGAPSRRPQREALRVWFISAV